MRLWDRCEHGVYVAERCAVFACVGVMFAMLVSQVVSRYLLGHALVFSEEVARLALVCGAFLGAAILAHDGRFIAVTFGSAESRWAKGLDLVAGAVVVTGAMLVIVATVELIPAHARLKLPASGLPRGLMPGAVVLGMGLTIVHVVSRAVRAHRPAAAEEASA